MGTEARWRERFEQGSEARWRASWAAKEEQSFQVEELTLRQLCRERSCAGCTSWAESWVLRWTVPKDKAGTLNWNLWERWSLWELCLWDKGPDHLSYGRSFSLSSRWKRTKGDEEKPLMWAVLPCRWRGVRDTVGMEPRTHLRCWSSSTNEVRVGGGQLQVGFSELHLSSECWSCF